MTVFSSGISLYAMGKRMIAYYPYVPVGYAIGCGCAIMSYDQNLYFGLTSDTQAMPDVEKLKEALDQSFIELRQCRSSGPKKLRTTSGASGAAIDSQNERNAFLACAGDPFASAPATIAALIAPALVPLNCVMATLRLARRASNTPQV